MKRFLILFLLLSVIVGATACTSSKHDSGSFPAELTSVFVNEMPEEVKQPSDNYKVHSVYSREYQALLGDLNYVNCFTIKFNDYLAFQEHVEGIDTSLAEKINSSDYTSYVFRGDKDGFLEYTNTEIYDGYFFVYEIISVNENTLEVNYLYAYVWDYDKDEFLISRLEELYVDVMPDAESDTITYESGEFDNKNWNDTVGTYCSDVIPDEDTALKVAQAIFDGIEKNKIEQEYVPYSVFYDEQDEIWIVSFGENLDEFSDEIIVGGGCDIAMQKKDGKVLRIWFGE